FPFFHLLISKYSSFREKLISLRLSMLNTVKPAYNDSAYGDTPLITTLFPVSLPSFQAKQLRIKRHSAYNNTFSCLTENRYNRVSLYYSSDFTFTILLYFNVFCVLRCCFE